MNPTASYVYCVQSEYPASVKDRDDLEFTCEATIVLATGNLLYVESSLPHSQFRAALSLLPFVH